MSAGAASGRGLVVSADWVIADALDEPLRNSAVRVVNGLVHEVGPTADLLARFPEDAHHHAAGATLIPGFVNAHIHLYGVLAHGVPAPADPPADFWGFLADYWWPLVEDALDHEMIAAAAEWVTAELAASGTTTFFDILEAPNALPDALEVQAEAVRRRGLRGVLSFEATERRGAASGRAGLDENVGFIEACRAFDQDEQRRVARQQPAGPSAATSAGGGPNGGGNGAGAAGRVSGAMCIHTTFTCGEPFIREAFELADHHDVFCHAHVNEGAHEGRWCEQHHGMRTLEYYDSLGVASPRFQASQCVQISECELQIIAERGVRVSHMPLSNCEVGGGIAPLVDMLDRGVTVGLGSDGYINDMFSVMRAAFLLQRAATCDPGAISAAQVLHLATEGAAWALGLERVGRLEPGWHADMVLVNTDGPHGLPTPVDAHNLAEQLVLWRNRGDVTRVMAAGRWIAADGVALGADPAQLRANTMTQATRLWS